MVWVRENSKRNGRNIVNMELDVYDTVEHLI